MHWQKQNRSFEGPGGVLPYVLFALLMIAIILVLIWLMSQGHSIALP